MFTHARNVAASIEQQNMRLTRLSESLILLMILANNFLNSSASHGHGNLSSYLADILCAYEVIPFQHIMAFPLKRQGKLRVVTIPYTKGLSGGWVLD